MKMLKTLILVAALSLPVLATSTVYADDFNPLEAPCTQGTASQSEVCESASSTEDPTRGENSIFVAIANILTIVAGAIAVIMMIISGITMISSGGDPAKVKRSRDTIIYSAVGIVVVVAARTIVLFIVGSLT